MNPGAVPFARELFAQWQRARGARTEPASRHFSRAWEELLDDADITTAAAHNEAEADARSLANAGWLELKPVRYKPHLLARITLPLSVEARWCEAFGFLPPTNEEARRIREFPWAPELAFLREARVNLLFEELRQLNDFLLQSGGAGETVPLKERSLEIFGDEKRLDMLADSALFQEGRLTLAQLRCEIVAEPLGWKRGPSAANAQPVIVLENAATWHSYARWNDATSQFSAVIYGGGNRFVEGVGFLAEIFRELGGPRRVFYFGDLDPAGLSIPQRASQRARELGLPSVEPHLWSYGVLLRLAQEHAQRSDGSLFDSVLCDWLAEHAPTARQLLTRSQRLAQERVGWACLRHHQQADC